MKLSTAQTRFLAIVYTTDQGYRTPFVGGRDAGRIASAWYRTAGALARKGLILLKRSGDAQIAYRNTLTDEGRKVAAYYDMIFTTRTRS